MFGLFLSVYVGRYTCGWITIGTIGYKSWATLICFLICGDPEQDYSRLPCLTPERAASEDDSDMVVVGLPEKVLFGNRVALATIIVTSCHDMSNR